MILIRILQFMKVSNNTKLTEKIKCKNDTVIAFKSTVKSNETKTNNGNILCTCYC